MSCIDLSVQLLSHACCYQHVFYFVQINMDGWIDGRRPIRTAPPIVITQYRYLIHVTQDTHKIRIIF